MILKTEAEIAQEITEAQAELAKMQQNLADRQAMEPEKRLAMDLHEITCGGRYVGRCDWGNGGGWDRNSEMQSYLERATNLLAVTTHEQAMETVRVALGR